MTGLLVAAVVSWSAGPGTTVALVEDHRAPLVVAVVEIPVGTASPWARETGAALAWEAQALDPEGKLRGRADALAATLALAMGERSATLRAEFLADDLDAVAALIRDVLHNRSLDPREIRARRRGEKLAYEELSRRTDFVIGRATAERLFSPGDARRLPFAPPPSRGPGPDGLVATRDAILALPGRTIGLAGDLGRDAADRFARTLGLPEVGPAPAGLDPVFLPTREIGRDRAIPLRKLTQVYYGYGRDAPSWNDPDWPAFLIADHVLGGHFYSRLSIALRHESGDTYGVWTETRAGVPAAAYVVKTFTRAANAAAVDAKVRAVVARLGEEGITEEERAAAAGYLLGRRAFARQSPEQILATWRLERRNGLPEGFFDDAARRAAATPLEEVNAFARRWFAPSAFAMVTATPE